MGAFIGCKQWVPRALSEGLLGGRLMPGISDRQSQQADSPVKEPPPPIPVEELKEGLVFEGKIMEHLRDIGFLVEVGATSLGLLRRRDCEGVPKRLLKCGQILSNLVVQRIEKSKRRFQLTLCGVDGSNVAEEAYEEVLSHIASWAGVNMTRPDEATASPAIAGKGGRGGRKKGGKGGRGNDRHAKDDANHHRDVSNTEDEVVRGSATKHRDRRRQNRYGKEKHDEKPGYEEPYSYWYGNDSRWNDSAGPQQTGNWYSNGGRDTVRSVAQKSAWSYEEWWTPGDSTWGSNGDWWSYMQPSAQASPSTSKHGGKGGKGGKRGGKRGMQTGKNGRGYQWQD
jgi:hypothetical protein